MKLLVRALTLFLRDRVFQARPATFGVLLAWCSLPQDATSQDAPQLGPPLAGDQGVSGGDQGGSARGKASNALQARVLDAMGTFYSHPHTVTLALTALPADYPGSFSFTGNAAAATGAADVGAAAALVALGAAGSTVKVAGGGGEASDSVAVNSVAVKYRQGKARARANAAAYHARGWTTLEYAVSGLVKPAELLLDLGKLAALKLEKLSDLLSACKSTRRPPMMPADFDVSLSTMSFADKEELQLVASQYAKMFQTRIVRASTLNYENLKCASRSAPFSPTAARPFSTFLSAHADS